MRTHDSPALLRRFWSKVAVAGPDDCWLWLSPSLQRGYGAFYFQGRMRRAHRMAWFLSYGRWPEPEGLHNCDEKRCCNPAHLYEGTHRQNALDAMERRLLPYGDRHWLRRASLEERQREGQRLRDAKS